MAQTQQSDSQNIARPETQGKQLSYLPEEVKLLVFSDVVRGEICLISTKASRARKYQSKYNFSFLGPYSAFGFSTELGRPYHEALGDYIFKEAPEVSVNVVDFKFTNLRAFLSALKKAGRLADFQALEDGETSRKRSIQIAHIVTPAFPDNFNSILRFTTFADGLVEKLNDDGVGDGLCMHHRVVHCDDIRVIERLLPQMVDFENESPGGEFHFAIMALRDHHEAKIMETLAKKRAEEVLRTEKLRRLAASSLNDAGEAVRGAEQDEVMDEGDLRETSGGDAHGEDDLRSVSGSNVGSEDEIEMENGTEDEIGEEIEDEMEQDSFNEDSDDEVDGEDDDKSVSDPSEEIESEREIDGDGYEEDEQQQGAWDQQPANGGFQPAMDLASFLSQQFSRGYVDPTGERIFLGS